MKAFHFIRYPEVPPMTRKERLQERKDTERMFSMAKLYLAIVIPFVLALYVWAWIHSVNAEKPDTITKVQSDICTLAPKSALCSDLVLLTDIDDIAKRKGVPTRLILWIMYSESTLHTNYNKPICKTYNNPFGLKWKKYDDWHVVWFSGDRRKGDDNGCWLYKFSSIQEATESLANTLAVGYKSCNFDTTCIAYSYVWHPDIAEQSWIDRVQKIYNMSR